MSIALPNLSRKKSSQRSIYCLRQRAVRRTPVSQLDDDYLWGLGHSGHRFRSCSSWRSKGSFPVGFRDDHGGCDNELAGRSLRAEAGGLPKEVTSHLLERQLLTANLTAPIHKKLYFKVKMIKHRQFGCCTSVDIMPVFLLR